MAKKRGPWRSPLAALRIIRHQDLWLVQEGQCAYCGRVLDPSEATFDHVWPKRRKNKPPEGENLVLACLACNKRKGGRDPRQFVRGCHPGALIFQIHPELRQN